MSDDYSQYCYRNDGCTDANLYLLPPVLRLLEWNRTLHQHANRLFEWGCGNGYCASVLQAAGYDVTGIDLSESGIRHARAGYPGLKLAQGSVLESQVVQYGSYPVVLSMEVIEHLPQPRLLVANMFEMLEPGGLAIITTPYHGYWKNLALAVMGRMDSHFTALWDGGHIKFWSIDTLTTLLQEAGFSVVGFERAGRIPPLAKSMIAIARKPLVAASR